MAASGVLISGATVTTAVAGFWGLGKSRVSVKIGITIGLGQFGFSPLAKIDRRNYTVFQD